MTASTERSAARVHLPPDNLPRSVRALPLNVPGESEEWRLQARCRGMDPAVFFHPDGERGHARSRRAAYAKAVCAECPVVQDCRKSSLERNERFGVWGGMSEDERDAVLANPRDRNRRATKFAVSQGASAGK